MHIKFSHISVSQVLNQQTQSEPVIPVYQPLDERDDFLSMVHVTLKFRSDILGHPTHQGLNVCKEDAIACVPKSLYMFIRLMPGGQSLLENGLNDCDDDDMKDDSYVIDDDGDGEEEKDDEKEEVEMVEVEDLSGDDDSDEEKKNSRIHEKCAREKTRTTCGN